MQVKLFSILVTLFILGWVIDCIRREKMTFKYAVSWFAGCAVAVFFAINDTWLIAIARWAGFSLPSNFIFFMLLVFVMFMSLLMTLYINEQNSRAEALAQAVARLEHQIKKIESDRNKN